MSEFRLGPVQPDEDAVAAAAPPLHPAPWEVRAAHGPVIGAALHAGHDLSAAAAPYMRLSPQERMRDEDPLTDFLLGVADTTIRVNRSRFEVDLNRPLERAVYRHPGETWGLCVWDGEPPAAVLAAAQSLHRRFYQTVGRLMDDAIARHGCVLVLDLHSYNHRRGGPATAAHPAGNPDIDLGITTLDRQRFEPLLQRFTACLRDARLHGRSLDVRANVRYPGGGYFPEWLYRRHGESACVISLEYKKVFMNEWTSLADVAALQVLRGSLARAVDAARDALPRCR